jgi:hypothetical protein
MANNIISTHKNSWFQTVLGIIKLGPEVTCHFPGRGRCWERPCAHNKVHWNHIQVQMQEGWLWCPMSRAGRRSGIQKLWAGLWEGRVQLYSAKPGAGGPSPGRARWRSPWSPETPFLSTSCRLHPMGSASTKSALCMAPVCTSAALLHTNEGGTWVPTGHNAPLSVLFCKAGANTCFKCPPNGAPNSATASYLGGRSRLPVHLAPSLPISLQLSYCNLTKTFAKQGSIECQVTAKATLQWALMDMSVCSLWPRVLYHASL